MELLYLTHRIPFPPDKGDKIRTYNLLREMADRWTVHLGTFVDDPDDWQHVPRLEAMCGETRFIGLSPVSAKARALTGLVRGTSLTMPYYHSTKMRSWVVELMERRRIDCAMAFSSSMGQYLPLATERGVRCVVDFCDMDSDKWRQYGESFSGLKRWVYTREANKLRGEETDIGAANDASVFISDDEASLYCRQTGIPADKVHSVRNGVDTGYFDPALEYPDPYAGKGLNIAFVGAMDYWPNVDAVTWFVDRILPGVRDMLPDSSFWIIGSNPGRNVAALGARPGVTVTGRVSDVRPYLGRANCVVAPLRVARGVQNKVLEAMAMAKPVVASPAALEGLSFGDDTGIRVCDSESDWIGKVSSALREYSPDDRVAGARDAVMRSYSWEASARDLTAILTREAAR